MTAVLEISWNFISENLFYVLCGRSSLNKNNDNTTYGAFVDVDPAREKLSLKSLVSFYL